MSDKELFIKLGADVSALRSGMESGVAAITASINNITSMFSRMAADTTKSTKEAANSAKGMASQLSGAFEGMSAVAGRFNVVMAGVGAVLAGGAIFREAISATNEFTGEATRLSRAMGITQTEAATLVVALGDVYATTEQMAGASGMLARQLRSNEEGLNKMGLVTRNTDGSLRGMKDLMLDAIKVANTYKEGIDRNMAAQVLFGRGAQEAANMLRLNTAAIEEAERKQKELGLVIGVESVAATRAYKAAMNDAGDVLLALKKVIGDALLPILTKFGEWFATIGPAAVTILKAAIGALIAPFWVLHGAVNAVWQILVAMFQSVKDPLIALGKAMSQVANGDFAGAAATMKALPSGIAARWKTATSDIADTAIKDAERIRRAFSSDTPITVANPSGNKNFVDPKDKGAAGSDGRLEAMRMQFQQEIQLKKDFFDTSLNLEIAYWEKQLTTVKGKGDADKKLRFQITQELYNLRKAAAQQDRALDEESIAQTERITLARLNAERSAMIEQKNARQISLKEAMQWEIVYANQEYQIKLDTLKEKEKLYQNDKVALAKVLNEQQILHEENKRNELTIAKQYAREELADKIAALRRETEELGNNFDERKRIAEAIMLETRKVYGAESREAQEAAAEVGRIERQKLEQKKQLAAEEIALRRSVKLASVDGAAQAAQLERDLGMITGVQLLELQKQFESERYAIERAGLEERLSLVDRKKDPVEYARINGEILQLELQHQQALAQIRANLIKEQNKELLGAFGSIESGLSSAFAGLMKGTTNFKQFMLNVAQSISNAFIDMFAKILAKEIVTKVAGQVFAKKSAAADIQTQAARAGAGGVASMASAPFPMSLNAPAFGQAMFAAAMAFQGGLSLPSAAGGFDIPSGSNPLTQLHEREMVLPAQYADTIRDMAEGGGAGAANIRLEVHPDAMRMTLNDWLQGELARQAARR
jgi:hypothetical protein